MRHALDTSTDTRFDSTALIRAAPTGITALAACLLAWETSGSIRAGHWLPYATVTLLVLAVVLCAGTAVRPGRLALVSALLLTGFAIWTALSATWAPIPSLARDDALLALLYAVAFATPLLTLRSPGDRVAATAVVVFALSGLAVLTGFWLRLAGEPDILYYAGRLDFPVTYWNGEAAIVLVGLWPAIVLAALRDLHPALRAVSLGGAAAMLALWLGTQSKGGGVAFAVSGIVLFAVSPMRLRLVIPAAVAAAFAGVAAVPLTEPFRADGPAFEDAVRRAGTVTIGVAAGAALAGLVYALVDRRLFVSDRARRIAGAATLAAVVLCALGGIGVFFAAVDQPIAATEQRWHDFTRLDRNEAGSSHFSSLGSNRYDFWRVAWNEFERHPVAGIGAYGWADAYLLHRRSDEAPQRSHSVEMDALSEGGIVGFFLLVAAGLTALVAAGRSARRSAPGAAGLAAGVYFAVHTGGDWVWTMPAVGLPALLLVGIGIAGHDGRRIQPRVGLPTGIAVAAIAVLGFLPPWLSAKLVDRAYDTGSLPAAAGDLRWARRLDPLAIEPLIAQSSLATPPDNLPPLRRAVERQPRVAELHYLLGLAYLEQERTADAQVELRKALALSPRDVAIRSAVVRAGG